MRAALLCYIVLLNSLVFSSPVPIRGIVLVENTTELLSSEQLKQVDGLDVSHVSLPGPSVLLQKDLDSFLCSKTKEEPCLYQWNNETISKIKQTIYHYYQNQGRPFIRLSVPEQNHNTHVLQVVVEESKLGKVEVKGNKWVPDSRFERYLSLKQGQPISQKRLNRDVDFMNRNPFRHVDVFYSPGTEENTTDLTLQVHDRKSYRFYSGMNNMGVASTGRQRVFAGFNWDQMFGLDQTFFYQYTTGFEVNRFHANSFQYTAFLPNKQILDIFGGFAIVSAHIPFPNRHNQGTNIQASARYHFPFYPQNHLSHELNIGFDLKNTNNTMEFVEFFATYGKTVNLTQFSAAYKCKYEHSNRFVEGGAEIVFSPFQWLPGQSTSDFESLRPGAENRWVYLRGYCNYRQPLPQGFSTLVYLLAQWTEQTLLPSEQVGIGGYGTVRGYDERQYNADSALLANFELHSPSFSIFRSKQPNRDQMSFLVFCDVGGGYDDSKAPGAKWANILAGVGPGVRYNFGPYLSARLDWAVKLHNQDLFTGGSSMFHFSFTGSY